VGISGASSKDAVEGNGAVLQRLRALAGSMGWERRHLGVDWRVSYALFVLGMMVFGWLTLTVVRQIIGRRVARDPSRLDLLVVVAGISV
jgi:hypothetical protein